MSGISKIQECGGKLLQNKKMPGMYVKLCAIYLDKDQDIKLARIKYVRGSEVDNWLPVHYLLSKYEFVDIPCCEECKVKCVEEVNNFEE